MIGVIILMGALLLAGVFLIYLSGRLLEKAMDIEELLFHACAALGSIGTQLGNAGEKGEDSGPDSPDEDGKSEEDKNAEKRFTEGVYNILNYECKKGTNR